ncbi:MAG TPA: MFS transporter [Burkholderiaceae bacterium]|nr:MFS transporter [Burkholderiaceae bacterium]
MNHQENSTAASPRAWSAVGSMTLCVALLIASEFMPVSLLTPIARDLGATEGLAGQAISVSGLFAVATSLLITSMAGRIDRRHLLPGLTAAMLVSLVLIAAAPNFGFLMAARALLGVTIGGFWSLSTATIVRLVPPQAVPKALSVMYMGNAAATAFAAPIGSYLGGLLGWRGVFWALAPLAAIAMAWQWISLPSMPSAGALPVARVLGLLHRPVVARAMAAVMLTFGGAFAAFTYFRPFLESRAHATLPQLSLLLLALGSAGFIGTFAAGALMTRHLHRLLRMLPIALAAVTAAMLLAQHALCPLAVLLFAWGALNAAMPVSWFNWLTRGVRDEPEAGGGLMVAAIQLAIMLGASLGGWLLDHLSVSATLIGGALLMAAGTLTVGSGRALRAEPA